MRTSPCALFPAPESPSHFATCSLAVLLNAYSATSACCECIMASHAR